MEAHTENKGWWQLLMGRNYWRRRWQLTDGIQTWRKIYLVMRPNTLSIYKSEKEEKLRHKLYLSDLTAVTMLKDPKNKRQNVFGLFSPSKNYHFQAESLKDAQEWVDLIRQDARIEEEEEEMFLASPPVRNNTNTADPSRTLTTPDVFLSSSPEPPEAPVRTAGGKLAARRTSQLESSGLSGAELASHSDFSDTDAHRIPAASFESLALQQQHQSTTPGAPRTSLGGVASTRPSVGQLDADSDRIVWQGWMWFHRSKGAVRQWKKSWGVLRPRNFILYKDEAESSVLFVLYLASIVNVVEIDPVSRTKKHCLQIITDEKTYRFCTRDEEALVQCLGAFKSLLAKRRDMEAKASAAAATQAAPSTQAPTTTPATAAVRPAIPAIPETPSSPA